MIYLNFLDKFKKTRDKMARKQRRILDDTFKIKVVLEALKEEVPLGELASKYELHSNQIIIWKKQFLANAENVFGGNKSEKQEIEK
jgi:transposase